jgi:hypothetical protein
MAGFCYYIAMENNHPSFLSLGEKILILSGLLFILSTLYLALDGNFLVYLFAKAIYGLGILIFIFKS